MDVEHMEAHELFRRLGFLILLIILHIIAFYYMFISQIDDIFKVIFFAYASYSLGDTIRILYKYVKLTILYYRVGKLLSDKGMV